MKAPTELLNDADRLRERAEEIAEENPTAAEYCLRRAAWCDYLARTEKDQEGGAR